MSSPLDILVEDNQILEVGNECDLLRTNHKNYILVLKFIVIEVKIET